MKIQITILKIFLLGMSLLPFYVFAEPVNPHTISSNNKACMSCHVKQPKILEKLNTKNNPIDYSTFNVDGVKMCITCHAEEEGHVVGVSIDFSIPADLPLDSNQSITCLTCHYTHGSLKSDRPQASYSFMDSLLGSERLHKSYLIRRNNVNGELCLTCHNAQLSK